MSLRDIPIEELDFFERKNDPDFSYGFMFLPEHIGSKFSDSFVELNSELFTRSNGHIQENNICAYVDKLFMDELSVIPVGFSYNPAFSKEFSIAIMVEDRNTFERKWFHFGYSTMSYLAHEVFDLKHFKR